MAPIETNCPSPSCGTRLRVRAEAAGKQVKCPRCQKPFTVPDGTVQVVVPTPRSSQPIVFVSHAHEDRPFVEQTIKPLLQRHGIQAWWSEENIRSGEDWQTKIREAVRESDWFLLVMSPWSEDSEWVKREIRWAFAEKPHRIIPVLQKKCAPEEFHPRVRQLHFVDFTGDPENAGRKLLADMMQKLHEQARESTVKVDEITKQNEELKETLVELDRKQKELATQVQGVLGFDGTYTHAPLGNIPPFRPLEQRGAPIVAVLNLKGGVGKTTLTANLGASLWSRGPRKRVLLVDLDYQANLSLSCVGRDALKRLSRQKRLVQELFRQGAGDPLLTLRCTEPIYDDNQRVTEGWLLACDGALNLEETQALMRWLLGSSKTDLRYILRNALHSEAVQAEYDYILLDCPPRLTPTTVNALTACDYLLIPVILDEKSTEGPPQLLKWLWDRREALDLHVGGIGLLANKTKFSRENLVGREKQEWAELVQQCRDHWQGPVYGFDTVVTVFTEPAMERKFPACYAEMGGLFARLADELKSQVSLPAGVAS